MRLRLLPLLLAGASFIHAEPAPSAADGVVQNYCAATRDQRRFLSAMSMDMEIEASLPKLKKEGRLHALRRISSIGRITYEALRFEGDNTVKNNVIARYLTAEAQAQSEDEAASIAVTPENYKFKYKGMEEVDGRQSHRFQVTPRKKRVGLFKGELWIDDATHLRVQEAGVFVKNPSVFLKKIAFIRRYVIRDGLSVPRVVQSTVDTRLVGRAQLNIAFSNFSLDGQRRAGAADGEGQ